MRSRSEIYFSFFRSGFEYSATVKVLPEEVIRSSLKRLTVFCICDLKRLVLCLLYYLFWSIRFTYSGSSIISYISSTTSFIISSSRVFPSMLHLLAGCFTDPYAGDRGFGKLCSSDPVLNSVTPSNFDRGPGGCAGVTYLSDSSIWLSGTCLNPGQSDYCVSAFESSCRRMGRTGEEGSDYCSSH